MDTAIWGCCLGSAHRLSENESAEDATIASGRAVADKKFVPNVLAGFRALEFEVREEILESVVFGEHHGALGIANRGVKRVDRSGARALSRGIPGRR